MRVLVGILHCIEQEKDLCLASLAQQQPGGHRHFVITGRPNREAHTQLYRTFMRHAGSVDLFLKLDADMVLCRPDFIRKACQCFLEDPELDDLEVAVDDFFTGQLVFGLHVYRSRVVWSEFEERTFVDLGISARKRRLDNTELAPAALHCPDPGRFQSYHFGLHKAVKVLQRESLRRNFHSAAFHWLNIQRIIERWRKFGDARLGLAAMGARDAFLHRLGPADVDFDSPTASRLYGEAECLGQEGWSRALERTDWLDITTGASSTFDTSLAGLLRIGPGELSQMLGATVVPSRHFNDSVDATACRVALGHP
jgi:hypothetical protein